MIGRAVMSSGAAAARLIVAALPLLVCGSLADAEQGQQTMTRATGTFDVKVKPQATDDYTDAVAMARMTIDKQFHGDLDGTSKGQMLTAMGAKESGAYVAVEKFTGTLHGKQGSFALHHTGVMTRGAPSLTVTVVPDSGTGDLEGLAGSMTIDIAKDGTHSYILSYTLAPRP